MTRPSNPSRRSVRAALKPARPPPMIVYTLLLSLTMRRVISLAGSKADFFMGSIAERFVLRASTAAEIDCPSLVSLGASVYPMTARPHQFDVSGNHIRSVQSRGNPNAHVLLLPGRIRRKRFTLISSPHLL